MIEFTCFYHFLLATKFQKTKSSEWCVLNWTTRTKRIHWIQVFYAKSTFLSHRLLKHDSSLRPLQDWWLQWAMDHLQVTDFGLTKIEATWCNPRKFEIKATISNDGWNLSHRRVNIYLGDWGDPDFSKSCQCVRKLLCKNPKPDGKTMKRLVKETFESI